MYFVVNGKVVYKECCLDTINNKIILDKETSGNVTNEKYYLGDEGSEKRRKLDSKKK